MDYPNVSSKVEKYNVIRENTKDYRIQWNTKIKKLITDTLKDIIKKTNIPAYVELKDEIENLEVIGMSLGTEISGIAEKLPGNKVKRPFIKSNGSLIFQELFNGKIMIMIMYPYIEGYGEPRSPKSLEILRPHELKKPFIIRYVEEFLQEIIEWEDFDDDVPEKMGLTPIGFGVQQVNDRDEV